VTLRGQAELQMAKPVANWANGWKETVRKVIKNYQRHWTAAEVAEVVGADRATQIEEFFRADLDTCLEYVATTTGLPRTRDEKRQEMITLFDKGAMDINDQNVKQKAFELFGETGMFKTFNDDARRARVNVKALRVGKPAQFRPGIDDASIHLGIALETAKGLDFDLWDPQAQQALFQYIAEVRGAQAAEAAPIPPGAIPPGGQVPSSGAIPPGPKATVQ
jgi:hypothetical protein